MEFYYSLPKEKIAKFPPKERGTSRLMIVNRTSGEIIHDKYFNIYKYLEPTDLVILNNTKVIPARISGEKQTGGKVEFLFLEKHKINQNKVQYKGKVKKGDLIEVYGTKLQIKEVLGEGIAEIEMNPELPGILEKFGTTPIPPYLQRESNDEDKERYQTMIAKYSGSVAAPTATLNLTPDQIKKMREKGIEIAEITLHVGLGTFLPIRTEKLEEHKMHAEYYEIPFSVVQQIQNAKNENRKIVAFGTTVTRAMEHSKDTILTSKTGIIDEADIFIKPGYKFQIIDKLITNFHAPDSTVIQLAAAFSGVGLLKKAYQEALENDYKFLSYGDSMLII